MNRSFLMAALSSAVVLSSLSVSVMAQGISEYAGALGASSATTGAAGRAAGGHRDSVNNLYGGAAGMLNQVSGSGNASSAPSARTTQVTHFRRKEKGANKALASKSAASDDAALQNLLKQRYDLAGNEIPLDPRATVLTVGKMANQLFAEGQQKEKAGKLKEAELLYMRAVRMRNRFWGDSDPAVIRLYMLIGNIEMKQKQPEGAEPFFKRALQANLKRHGNGSYELVEYLDALGNSFYAQQKYSDAANYYRQVRTLRERKLGADDQLTLSASIRLAKANAQRGDSSLLPGAEQMLRSTVVTLESRPQSKTQYIAALEGLELVLRNQNKAQEADAMLAKINELKGPAATTAATEKPAEQAQAPAAKPVESATKVPLGQPTDLTTKPETKQTDATATAPAVTPGSPNTAPAGTTTVAPTKDSVAKIAPEKPSPDREETSEKPSKKHKNK